MSPQAMWWSVVGLSLLVRLLALVSVADAPLASDAQSYTESARQLVSGQPFIPYWPPGVGLFLAPFVALGVHDVGLRAVSLIFWLAACWGLYRLMRTLQLQDLAWLVLLVFSLLPDSIQMAVEPMTQMPTAALLLIALSAAVRCLRGAGFGEYLLLGASLAVLSLVRPSAMALALLPLVILFVTRRFAASAASLALAAVLILAWMQHAHSMTGRWMINTANSINLYYGNNVDTPMYRTWFFGSHAKTNTSEIKEFPEFERTVMRIGLLPRLEQPAEYQRVAVEYVERNPGAFLHRTVNRFLCFFAFDTFTSAALQSDDPGDTARVYGCLAIEAAVYFLFAGSSFFWIARAPAGFWRHPVNPTLLGAIVLYSAPYWISMSHPTYHFPILLPLGVLGLNAWRSVQQQKDGHRRRAWIALLFFLMVQLQWGWEMSHR